MEKFVINIIGTGYDICIGEIPRETQLLFSNTKSGELQHLLFDEDFYKRYLIKSCGKTVHSWNDFNSEGVYRGADIFKSGQIEIWINSKRVKTYKFSELNSQSRLFPLFECSLENIINKNRKSLIMIGVQEKGFLAKFSFMSKGFLIENLKLHFANISIANNSIRLLTRLSYLDNELKSVKSDTNITGTVFQYLY